MTLYDRLRAANDGDRIPVRAPATGKEFTISVRYFAGVRGYGVVPAGRKRVTRAGHMMIDPDVLRAWAENLEEVTDAHD